MNKLNNFYCLHSEISFFLNISDLTKRYRNEVFILNCIISSIFLLTLSNSKESKFNRKRVSKKFQNFFAIFFQISSTRFNPK